MKTEHRIEINGRVLFVAFRSSYQGVSDYMVSHRGQEPARVHVVWPDDHDSPFAREIRMEHDTDKARRFEIDMGFPWADACAAVRQAIAQQFDADVREIVERGWLDGASAWVLNRARELKLIAA